MATQQTLVGLLISMTCVTVLARRGSASTAEGALRRTSSDLGTAAWNTTLVAAVGPALTMPMTVAEMAGCGWSCEKRNPTAIPLLLSTATGGAKSKRQKKKKKLVGDELSKTGAYKSSSSTKITTKK